MYGYMLVFEEYIAFLLYFLKMRFGVFVKESKKRNLCLG